MWLVGAIACSVELAYRGERAPEDPEVSPLPTEAPVGPQTPTATEPTPTTPSECWWEPLDPSADVGDVAAGFRSADDVDAALEVLLRRWPAGHDLLVEMAHDPYVDVFVEGGSFTAMMDSLMTVCHEETHGWDYEHGLYPQRFGYFLLGDLQITTPWIDGFPRSRILPLVEGNATSLYDGTYLTGTQGTYGFTELLDETNAYVNGLGGALAGADAIPWTFSGKDGALAFLYYLELYLGLAREEEPALYAELQADADVAELVVSLWLRTHFFLEAADAEENLGIEDREIRELVYGHQDELEVFLGYPLDASACLPGDP